MTTLVADLFIYLSISYFNLNLKLFDNSKFSNQPINKPISYEIVRSLNLIRFRLKLPTMLQKSLDFPYGLKQTLYCLTLILMQIHTMKILHCQISGLLCLLSLFPKNLKIYHADKLHFVQSSLKD